MPSIRPATNLPFRWDLARPDRLGTLLEGCDPPDLWFADELVVCAAKTLSRSGNGRLVFVGRSADSVFDLLSGIVANTDRRDKLDRLPFSFRGDTADLTAEEIARARAILAAAGITPSALAAAGRAVTFVDLVYQGNTFTNLYRLIHTWAAEVRAPWNAIRQRLRFIGITEREKTSPKTWRWQQHAAWTSELPANAVINVSIGWPMWCYLGNDQTKLTRSFRPELWTQEDAAGPGRDDRTRQALAEAVALVSLGRTAATRRAVVRVIADEPTIAEPWLRKLVHDLR